MTASRGPAPVALDLPAWRPAPLDAEHAVLGAALVVPPVPALHAKLRQLGRISSIRTHIGKSRPPFWRCWTGTRPWSS
jgi:hypothetical protein